MTEAAWGTIYYVDPSSAGGDGSTTATTGPQAAFASVAEAQAVVNGDQSGNSLLFKGGQYWREPLAVAGYGTSGDPFTIGSYGPGQAHFMGSANLGIYVPRILKNYAPNPSFETFTGAADDDLPDTFTGWNPSYSTFARSDNSPPAGSYSCELKRVGIQPAYLRQTGVALPQEANVTITMTQYSDGTGFPVVEIYQESAPNYYLQKDGTWGPAQVYRAMGNTSDLTWTTVTINFTCQAGYTGTYRVRFSNLIPNSSCFIDDLKIYALAPSGLAFHAAGAGANYAPNPSFEAFTGIADDDNADTFADWTISSNGFARSDNSPPAGSYSCELKRVGVAQSYVRKDGIALPLEAHVTITITQYSDGVGSPAVEIYQESEPNYYLQKDGTWGPSQVGLELGTSAHLAWTPFTINFTCPARYTGTYRVKFYNVNGSSSCFIDDVKIYVTEWINVSGDEYKILLPTAPLVAGWLNSGAWVKLARGTAGSLAAGEWDYVAPYFSINLGSGINPTGQQVEVAQRDTVIALTSKNHVTINGITAMFANNGNGFLLATGSTGVVIANCESSYNGNDGFNGQGAQVDTVIRNCIARYNGQGFGLGGAAGDGISFHQDSTGIIIEHNICEYNDKYGIGHAGDCSTTARYNLLRYNFIGHYVGSETTQPHWVYYNIIVSAINSLYGIGQGNSSTANVVYYNNTVIGAGPTSSCIGVFLGDGLKTVIFKNNIVTGFSSGIKVGDWGINFVGDYNNLWNNGTQYTSVLAGAHDVNVDPRFVDPASDYHLRPGSPCIRTGVNVGLTQDFTGNALGLVPCIGAFEYQGVIPAAPLVFLLLLAD